MHQYRKKPRSYETISLQGRVKWRLDAMCLAGRRSRTQTINLLIDYYLAAHPQIRAWVDERARDPKPIRLSEEPSDTVSEDRDEKRTATEKPPSAERSLTP
jgi:hypothetical protein